jgi:hypothetical protein
MIHVLGNKLWSRKSAIFGKNKHSQNLSKPQKEPTPQKTWFVAPSATSPDCSSST